MPALNINDLNNGKKDLDHIAAVATSREETVNDRLGQSSPTVFGAINSLKSFNPKGAFVAGAAYKMKDMYVSGGVAYVAIVDHVSSTVVADLAAGKVTVHQGATREDLGAPGGAELVRHGDITVARALDKLEKNSYSLRKGYAKAKGSSALANGVNYQLYDLNKSEVLSGLDGHTGVLLQTAGSPYIDVLIPYMVLIGDSIAEGHPALHGRLHPTYDAGVGDQPGQLSYEFAKRFGIPVINHGIGGQTSQQVRDRWPRDVLAQDVPIGDGLPNQTMAFANGQKPYMVYLHVGINDIFTDVAAATMKENFVYFAQSCRDNGILLVVDNIGPDDSAGFTLARQATASEVNRWLGAEFAAQFPEVYLMDYLDWASNGTRNFRTLRPGCFADDVHPSKAGYGLYADYVSRNITAPVFLQGLVLNSSISGLDQFSRASRVTFNGKTFEIPGADSISQIALGAIIPDEPTYRLALTEFTTVTGVGGVYTGFSEIYGVFESRRNAETIARPKPAAFAPSPETFVSEPHDLTVSNGAVVTAVFDYYVIGNIVFFVFRLTVVGGTTAAIANTTWFKTPFQPAGRAAVTFVGSNVENLGSGLIDTGGGGAMFAPTWAATAGGITAAGFFIKS